MPTSKHSRKLNEWSKQVQRDIEEVLSTPLPNTLWARWKLRGWQRVEVSLRGSHKKWISHNPQVEHWAMGIVLGIVGMSMLMGIFIYDLDFFVTTLFALTCIVAVLGPLVTPKKGSIDRNIMKKWWPWASHIEGIVRYWEEGVAQTYTWSPDQSLSQTDLNIQAERVWGALKKYVEFEDRFDIYEERPDAPFLKCLTFKHSGPSWDNRTPAYLRKTLLLNTMEPIFLKAMTNQGLSPLMTLKLFEYVDEAVQIIAKELPNDPPVVDGSLASKEKLLSHWRPSK